MIAACLLALLLAVGFEPARPSNIVPAPLPIPLPDDSREQLSEIESELLSAESVELNFEVESTGAFASTLSGTLRFELGNRLSLIASGTFGPQSYDLELISDGKRLTGGNGTAVIDTETPPNLREAVVLGLTRMGILHNLARLVAGSPPDHAVEGIGEWIIPSDVTSSETAGYDIAFDLLVSGTKTAHVDLAVSDKSGLPLRRLQIVEFPGGTMEVTETYSWK